MKDMIKSMKTRRSIRHYSNRDISDSLIEELLAIAVRASNTGNMQLYSVVITRSSEQKKLLAPAHFNQSMVIEAPVSLTFCADVNRFIRWASYRSADAGFDNFQTFITAAIDVSILAQTFCVAAEEKGLGICYLGTTTYNSGQIIEILKLPRLVMPITTVTCGYPIEDELISEQTDRLPLEAIIHKEKYGNYNEQTINKLYKAKESLDFNRRFMIENGKETLAQVFTDIRYTRANNEYFSKDFLKILNKQGFI